MTEEKQTEGYRELAIQWLMQQGVSTVLLTAQTGLFLYIGYYAVHTAIPMHLKSIQDGYTSHATMFKEIRTEDRETAKELTIEIKSLVQTIRKSGITEQ